MLCQWSSNPSGFATRATALPSEDGSLLPLTFARFVGPAHVMFSQSWPHRLSSQPLAAQDGMQILDTESQATASPRPAQHGRPGSIRFFGANTVRKKITSHDEIQCHRTKLSAPRGETHSPPHGLAAHPSTPQGRRSRRDAAKAFAQAHAKRCTFIQIG